MTLLTRRDLIRKVAERWKHQYENAHIPSDRQDRNRRILLALEHLDKETATPEDIRNIVGNESWTRLECSECGEEVEAVVILGKDPCGDGTSIYVCPLCILEARKLGEPYEP